MADVMYSTVFVTGFRVLRGGNCWVLYSVSPGLYVCARVCVRIGPVWDLSRNKLCLLCSYRYSPLCFHPPPPHPFSCHLSSLLHSGLTSKSQPHHSGLCGLFVSAVLVCSLLILSGSVFSDSIFYVILVVRSFLVNILSRTVQRNGLIVALIAMLWVGSYGYICSE